MFVVWAFTQWMSREYIAKQRGYNKIEFMLRSSGTGVGRGVWEELFAKLTVYKSIKWNL